MSSMQLVKKAGSPLLLTVATALMGLIFNFSATKYLSAEEFGIFALAQTLVLILVTVAKLGLEKTLIKYVAASKALQQSTQTSSVYTMGLLYAFVGIICTTLTAWLFKELMVYRLLNQSELMPLIPIVLLLIAPNTFLAINSGLLRGYSCPNLSIVFSGFATLVLSTFFILLFHPSTALSLIKLVLFAAGSACIASFFLCFAQLKLKLTIDWQQTNAMFSSCMPLWTSSIVTLVIQQFSVIILSRHVSLSEIGIYAISSKIAVLMSFALIAVNVIVTPKFSAFYAAGKISELKSLTFTANKVLFIIALLMAITLFTTAELILSFFGAAFVQGAIYLKILVLGQMVNLGTGSVTHLLIMTGNERVHQKNTLITAVTAICLVLLLVPKFGAIGAAVSTAVSMACQNLLSYYSARKLIYSK